MPFLAQPICGSKSARIHAKGKPLTIYSSGTIIQSASGKSCTSLWPTLNLSTFDIIRDILWTSAINLASNAESRAQNLLNTTLQLLRQGLESHRTCNFNDLIQCDRLAVLDVLLLLSVAGGLLEGLDDQRRCWGDDWNGGLSVLDSESDGDTESFLLRDFTISPQSSSLISNNCAYPVSSCLCNIFSDLLWRQTKRTDLGSKSGRSTNFTSSCSQVAAKFCQYFVLVAQI